MGENINNCCRICLDEKSDHISILEDATVHLHLKSCLAMSVSPNDPLPKCICKTCVTLLCDFYNFQLNARCSQDWLETCLQERTKKCSENKAHIQPLPDPEYNSDSLLEFLNNTANIEEYLNNLGKEDIPTIVNMLDKNQENHVDMLHKVATTNRKALSPKKRDSAIKPNPKLNMEVDVLDSEAEVVNELLIKETKPKKLHIKTDKGLFTCFACTTCPAKYDSIQKLSQHLGICDKASRTCIHCKTLFDSKQKMFEHVVTKHTGFPLTCKCGEVFSETNTLLSHNRVCNIDYASLIGCTYRCKQCKVIFKDRLQLYRHAKTHVMKAERRVCDICGHCFIGTEALTKHKKEEHEAPEGSLHRCKICKYTSKDRRDIYIHVQKHIAKEIRLHLCDTCGREFASHATLKRHSLEHEKLRHHCKICNKTFDDANIRDAHALQHSETVMCEKCGENINSCTLNLHNCI